MNIHEFQAKALLKKFQVKIQEGIIAETLQEAMLAREEMVAASGSEILVVKAQIHAGGRGKGGGVKLTKNKAEFQEVVKNILGMQLVTPQTGKEGKKVHKILIAQDAYYPGESETKEFYLSILLDRTSKKNMVLYSPMGGMDIEEVASKTPHLIFKEEIHPLIGLQNFQARKIAFNLGLKGKEYKEMVSFVTKLYQAYIQLDVQMFEINPVLKTSDNQILAVDAKVVLDDSALYRHPEFSLLKDPMEENPMEEKAASQGMSFVMLEGNIGCIVNGAGLAMATMDIILLSGGGEPANFLDLGGTADKVRVEKAIKLILQDRNVKLILINIFGGIVRCDVVAQGIIDAYRSIGDIPVPLIVRLQGNQAGAGKKLLEDSKLPIQSAILLKEAASKVSEYAARLNP